MAKNRLSEHLLQQAEELMTPGDDDSSPEEQEELRQIVKEIVAWTRKGRFAALPSGEREHWASHLVNNGHASRVIDEAFTHEALRRVPGKVRRVLKLSELWTAEPMDKETEALLEEAIRAYAEGLPGAAIALARATMERAMKVALGRPDSGSALEKLILEASSKQILSARGLDAAREVKRLGDTFLHRGGQTHENAEAAIIELREVLRQLGRGGLGAQSHA